MNFLWPNALLLLGLIPLLAAVYVWVQKRRRRYAVRFSSLSLIRTALPEQSRLRKFLPMALFFAALACLTAGLARPVATVQVPAGRATIMLALDVSGSMRESDIFPSRLEAAKKAALQFIENGNNNRQIGLVAFTGFAQLIQPPGAETEGLVKSIQNLTTGRGTAIGSGILVALDTIAEFTQSPDAETNSDTPGSRAESGAEAALQPDIIVLLTDGVYTNGPNPLDAAQLAVEQGIRVYPIGFGTETNDIGGGNPYFTGNFRRGFDEGMLKEIAAMTGGEYYEAGSFEELQKVFDNLPTFLITREETMELSVLFAAVAALLVTCAVLLAQVWHPLP